MKLVDEEALVHGRDMQNGMESFDETREILGGFIRGGFVRSGKVLQRAAWYNEDIK